MKIFPFFFSRTNPRSDLPRLKSIQICLFLEASLDHNQMASLYPPFPMVPHHPLHKAWVPHSAWQCQLFQNQLPPYSIIFFPENFMLFLSPCLKHPVLCLANSYITLKTQLKCCHLRDLFTHSPDMIPLYTQKNMSFPYPSTYLTSIKRPMVCKALFWVPGLQGKVSDLRELLAETGKFLNLSIDDRTFRE